MTFTYDLSNDIGKVRRTIPDKDTVGHFWSDEEITSFLSDEGDWRRASAACLEAMASDAAFVLQVIRVQNIQTDGSSVARELLKRAVRLRELADEAEANESTGFEIIEFADNDFAWREIIYKTAIRG